MLLSASTFFVAVSAGLEAVRPAMGAMNDGRSWAWAAAPSPSSMIAVIVAWAQRVRSETIRMVFPLRHAVTCACQDPARRDTANQLPSWIDSAHAVAGRLVVGGLLARCANPCNCGFGAIAVEASQLAAQDLLKLPD